MRHRLGFRSAILLVVLAASACTVNYRQNREYQAWLNAIDDKCGYSGINFYSPQDEEEFLKLGYQGYYGRITAEEFANRMRIKFPGNRLAIDCFASSFPPR
jgi:hypothetical protein